MAGFQVHKLQNEGDVMTKSDDFQTWNLNSVGRILCTNLKNEGDVMTRSDDFQRRNLISVGRILGTQT